jgi:hypothetical protein
LFETLSAPSFPCVSISSFLQFGLSLTCSIDNSRPTDVSRTREPMVSRPTRHPLLQSSPDSVLPLPLWKGRADEESLLRHPRHLDNPACDIHGAALPTGANATSGFGLKCAFSGNRTHNDVLYDPSRLPNNNVFILLYPRTIRNRKRSERSIEDPCDSQSKLFVCI